MNLSDELEKLRTLLLIVDENRDTDIMLCISKRIERLLNEIKDQVSKRKHKQLMRRLEYIKRLERIVGLRCD